MTLAPPTDGPVRSVVSIGRWGDCRWCDLDIVILPPGRIARGLPLIRRGASEQVVGEESLASSPGRAFALERLPVAREGRDELIRQRDEEPWRSTLGPLDPRLD